MVEDGAYNGTDAGAQFYHGQWRDPPTPRARVFWGDQADPESLRAAAAEAGPFDVVIDDGSHRSDHMLHTFHALFPSLSPGGVYIVEDLEANFIHTDAGSPTEAGMVEATVAKGRTMQAPRRVRGRCQGRITGKGQEEIRGGRIAYFHHSQGSRAASDRRRLA